jgi:DNA-binding phage protein
MKPKQIWTLGAFMLMFAIGLGTVFLGVVPQINQIQALEATRVQARDENLSKLVFLADLKRQAADKSALMAALEMKRQLVPSNLGIVEMMDELSNIATKRGLTIEKLSSTNPQLFIPAAPIKPNPAYSAAIAELGSNALFVSSLNFSLNGPMSQIAGAMEDLASGRRYVLISRVTVPKVNSLASDRVTADFAAQVFSLKVQ